MQAYLHIFLAYLKIRSLNMNSKPLTNEQEYFVYNILSYLLTANIYLNATSNKNSHVHCA
jgi:hypothetical protein